MNDNEFTVKPDDVANNPYGLCFAVAYFKDLDTVKITGAQVAKFFEAVFTHGRYWQDATDDADLPEFPQWMLE